MKHSFLLVKINSSGLKVLSIMSEFVPAVLRGFSLLFYFVATFNPQVTCAAAFSINNTFSQINCDLFLRFKSVTRQVS